MELTRDELEEGFQYLDELRESGVTNMFGATPFIQEEFGWPRSKAQQVHLKWMNTFDGSSVDERVERVLEKQK